MWFLLVLLFLQTISAPCQTTSSSPNPAPPLIIQAIDAAHLPISGAKVTVRPTGDKTKIITALTNEEGYATFVVPVDAEYSVEVMNAKYFRNTNPKMLRLYKPSGASHTAYFQIMLELGGVEVQSPQPIR